MVDVRVSVPVDVVFGLRLLVRVKVQLHRQVAR
jgi:hypothetical protein